MDEITKNRKHIVISISIVFAIFIIISIIYAVVRNNEANRFLIIVDNLSSCTPNISDDSKFNLSSSLYGIASSQNDLSHIKSASNYHANFREGSCETKNYINYNRPSYVTTAIVDIPDLQYSYKVRFNWLSSSTPVPEELDGMPIYVFCLPNDQLVYPEFGCSDNPSFSIEDDEITYIIPYSGNGYKLDLVKSVNSPSGYSIIATIIIPDSAYRDQDFDSIVFREEKLTEIKELLKAYSLDPDNYIIHTKFNNFMMPIVAN